MILLALSLLALLPQEADAPKPDRLLLKDGRKIEGEIVEYDTHILVKTPDGKSQKFPSAEVDKIERNKLFLEFPQVEDFGGETLAQGAWELLPCGPVVVAFPKGRADSKIHGIDIRSGAVKWTLDLTGRLGRPLLHGGFLYLLKHETFLDETRKYRHLGAEHSKEIHRLTLSVLDAATSEEAWSLVFDNNDRTDLLWKHQTDGIRLLPYGSRLLLLEPKRGTALKRNEIDPSDDRIFTTFRVLDPEKRKPVEEYDAPQSPWGGWTRIAGDLYLTGKSLGRNKFRVRALELKNGEQRWETEDLASFPLHVGEERFYVQDATHLTAWSLKDGRRVPRWSLEHAGAKIEAFDDERVFVFRANREPRAILAYDLKTAGEVFRIPFPERDELTFHARMGTLLLYTNRKNELLAFDVFLKCIRWTFAGTGGGTPGSAHLLGSGVLIGKDLQLFLIDAFTGDVVWRMPTDFVRTIPLDARTALGVRKVGLCAVRDRKAPDGAVFFSPLRTPLRYSTGVPSYSVPAREGTTLFTLGEDGVLVAGDLEKRRTIYAKPVSGTPPSVPAALGAHRGRVAIPRAKSSLFVDSASGERTGEIVHDLLFPEEPYPLLEDSVVLRTPAGIQRIDWKDGKPLWTNSDVGFPSFLHVGAKEIHVLDRLAVRILNARDGSLIASHDLDSPATRVISGDGAFFVLTQGSRLQRYATPLGRLEWTGSAKKERDPMFHYFGHIVRFPGFVVFTSFDGEVLALDETSGAKKWSRPAPKLTSPLVLHDGKIWFVAGDEGAVALDAATGKEVWSLPLVDSEKFVPVLLDGVFYFWSSDGWLVKPKT